MSGTEFCRICGTNDSKDNLLNPCACKGTNGSICEQCLIKWVNTRLKRQVNPQLCEICLTNYNILIRCKSPGYATVIYNLCKSRQLLSRLFLFTIFTTLTLILISLMVVYGQTRHWTVVFMDCVFCAIALTALVDVIKLISSQRRSQLEPILVKQDFV